MSTVEVTKHMIRTPYGVLTMTIETYSKFAFASPEMQWIQLWKVSKRGQHEKARAMQWFWEQRAKTEYSKVN